ncbi:Fic family protein [Dickeya sp. NCPPB 3274]|uniref:Fic/DOC family protein n=1 Tax=Dickeya sp. NCPPB 3274 TaxID=568766 RepID=UPI0003A33F06|nr:Fic family protein [Dickeya sp. NCPPB 3274]
MGRYNVFNSEGQYAQGSEDLVLKNRLGITNPDEIDGAELVLLEKLYHFVFEDHFPADQQLSVDLIRAWHALWLGNLYDWAGQNRSVNISKGGFLFASASQIPSLLTQFNDKCLTRYTPCTGMARDRLAEAIAVVHVELILIHPFREGNGRISRLVADVMAVQGGYPPLDYHPWEQNKTQYIGAIHAGVGMDYEPMKYWVNQALTDG